MKAKRYVIAVMVLAIYGAAPSASWASSSELYKIVTKPTQVRGGKAEKEIAIINISHGQNLTSGVVRCAFYGTKGQFVGWARARAPSLSPGQSLIAKVGIASPGESRMTARCRFIQDQ